MQKFKEFISEEAQVNSLRIEVDPATLENNRDSMNADFDRLTAAPYQNSIVFYNQLRGTLERYGMVIPPGATKEFLNFDGELAFELGDSGLYLYVVFNTHKDTKVEGYVQVVDEMEMNHLMNSDDDPREEEDDMEEEDEGEEESEEMEDDSEDEMSYGEKYRKRMDDDG